MRKKEHVHIVEQSSNTRVYLPNTKEADVIKHKEEIKFILSPRLKHSEPLEVTMLKTRLNWIKAKSKELIKMLDR